MISMKGIRRFRSFLRQLESAVESYNKSCCSQVSTAQCHVLMRIDADGWATVSDLAGTLHLDASTISRTVDGLVRAGYITRAEDPNDRRSAVLRLSSRGESLCSDINTAADAFFAKAINRIPTKEQSAVLKSFEILVTALSEVERERRQVSGRCNCAKR